MFLLVIIMIPVLPVTISTLFVLHREKQEHRQVGLPKATRFSGMKPEFKPRPFLSPQDSGINCNCSNFCYIFNRVIITSTFY